MASFNQTSPATRIALAYLTGGILLVIWTIVYLVYTHLHHRPEPGHNTVYFWCTGFILTGLTFIILGLSMGALGKSVRQADVGAPPVVMQPGVGAVSGQPVAGQPGAYPQTSAPTAQPAQYPQQPPR